MGRHAPKVSAVKEIQKMAGIVGSHALGNGLQLVTRQGKTRKFASFIWRRRDSARNPVNNGRTISITIGKFDLRLPPSDLQKQIARAHAKALEYSSLVFNGVNPCSKKRGGWTIDALFRAWILSPKVCSAHPTTQENHLKAYQSLIPEELRKANAQTVTTARIAELLAEKWHRYKSINNGVNLLRQVFFWAIASEKVSRKDNPVDSKALRQILGKPTAKLGHFARLAPDNIPKFFQLIFDRKPDNSLTGLVAFAILSGLRIKNAAWARDSQFTAENGIDILRIDRSEMKVDHGGDFKVPLSRQARWVKEHARRRENDAGGLFLRTARNGKTVPPTSSDVSKYIASLEGVATFSLRDEDTKDDEGNSKIMTIHGTSRSSFVDWARNYKRYNHPQWEHSYIEMCLDHKVDKYGGAYLRDDALEVKQEILQAWGDYCFSLVDMTLLETGTPSPTNGHATGGSPAQEA